MGKLKKSTKKFVSQKKKVAKGGNAPAKKRKKYVKTPTEELPEENQANGLSIQKSDSIDGVDVGDMDIDEFLEGEYLSSEVSEDHSDTDSLENLSGDDDDANDNDNSVILSSEPGIDSMSITDESSSDEENIKGSTEEDSDRNVTRKQNKNLKSEIQSHKAQLEALRELDPEFYEYLQSTDRQLLAFGDAEEDDSEEIEDEQEVDVLKKGKKEEESNAQNTDDLNRKMVTISMVDGWCSSAQVSASPGALRRLLQAYRAACHYGDTEDSVYEGLQLGSSAVYSRLMSFVLRECDSLFRRALDVSFDKIEEISSLTSLPRWKKMEPLLKSYLGNTLHALGQMTDYGMISYILRRLRASIIFFAPFPKLQRRVLKSALEFFRSADSRTRIQAILFIRSMAISLPPPAMDDCLKGVYRAFASNAKFVNASSAPHINFMASCVVEMYGINEQSSYQHAFGFIRQLAILLRQALTSKSKESCKEVYCWQTINCLELWAKVLATHCNSEVLRPLIHPVTQLLIGAAKLVPTPAYFPLRLRCTKALNKVSEATGIFIPVAPLCLEILQWKDLSRSPKPAPGDKSPDIYLQLRAGKSMLRAAAFQEEVIELAFETLAEHLAQWGCHVAFPELSHLSLNRLRKFAKTTSVEKFRKSARQLADAIERNIVFVTRERDSVSFAPKDLNEASKFLSSPAMKTRSPIVQHAVTMKERAQQRAALRRAETVAIGDEGTQIKGFEGVNLSKRESDRDKDEENTEGIFESEVFGEEQEKVMNKAQSIVERGKNELETFLGDVTTRDEDEVLDFKLSDDEDGDNDVEIYQKPSPSPMKKNSKRNSGKSNKNLKPKEGRGKVAKKLRK